MMNGAPNFGQFCFVTGQELNRFFSKIRLRVIIDEAEEFAYLKQMENEDNENYPQLIPLREIDYLTSILLLLLRQILHEHDTAGREGRCVISREQLHDRMMLFLEDVANRLILFERSTENFLWYMKSSV
jgi:hypothetical protein